MDKIDFVLPWVDGSDSAWIKQRNEYLGIKNDQKIGRASCRERV